MIEHFENAISDSPDICRNGCDDELRWTQENLVERSPIRPGESLMSRLEPARGISLNDHPRVLLLCQQADDVFRAVAGLAHARISVSALTPPLPMSNTAEGGGIGHRTRLPAGVQVIGQMHTDAALAGIAAWVPSAIPPVQV